MITGESIVPGDVLIGLPSTGLHTNGYSLARKLLFEVAGHTADTQGQRTGRVRSPKRLLKIHQSCPAPIRSLHDAGVLKGAAHPPGGGITDNTPRIIARRTQGAPRGSTPVRGRCCRCSNCSAKSGEFPNTTGDARLTSGSA